MVRGKSSPSEHGLEKIKSNNSLGFLKKIWKVIQISILSKYRFVVFIHVIEFK